MKDLRKEARRLISDPDHLRRKAAWIRQRASEGPPELGTRRIIRATELEIEATRLEIERETS